MRGQQKLLLSFMIGGLMLFYGIAVVAALTPQEIYKIAKDSTVHLFLLNAERSVHSTGSGFFVAPNHIATNYHVIEDMLTGEPKLVGGVKLVGKEDIYAIEDIVDFDKENDLAVAKVREVKSTGIDVPALPLGDSDTVQVGDLIYIMSNPLRLEGTFTDGKISNILSEDSGKILQMNATIAQGSSGGPVLNESGKVIGICVAGVGRGLDINFAIPVNYLKPLVKMPIPHPIVNNDSPSKISVGEIIPLTVNIISTKSPHQVTIHYKIYDKDGNELEPNNQKMRLRNQQSTSSTWVYKVGLPSQKHVGSIAYYIEIKYDTHLVFRYPRAKNRHYQVSIVDEKPPRISLLYPPEGAKFGANQEITIRAKVTDNIAVQDVHIHTSWFNNEQSQKLTVEGSSDIYTINITLRNIVTLRYHLTATDKEGNESRSEPRHLEIKITTQENFEKGIKLYERARYNEAIEALSSAVRDLEDPEQRAEAYLYLGGAKRGFGESNEKVKEQFQEAIRHNPDQALPPRIGQDHPIFAELLEEVRKELTGELTVISLPPQTEIWIFGTGTDRKMVGTGIVSSRLLKGNYIVEGIYAGKSSRRTVAIEPDRHTELNLEIPPDIKHDSPSRISVGKIIPLILNLISTKNPQQVTIYYTIYDRDSNDRTEQSEMRLQEKQPAPSTWGYKVNLPSQNYVGSIEYYITVEYDNHLVFRYPRAKNRHYQISIVDEKPPEKSPPDSPNVESENEPESEPTEIETPTDSAENEGESEQEKDLLEEEPNDDPPPPTPYQGIWVSVSADDASTFDWEGSYMLRLAYLREGKTHPTLGAQLDFSPDRTNMSAMFQWGPALGESKVAFTLLGGIAAYEDSPRSTHTTPIFGAGLKFYPRDKIVIDATSSIKSRSDYDTTDLYHYEIGARFYIIRELNLRIGYGKLYLGNRNFITIQIGLGYTF